MEIGNFTPFWDKNDIAQLIARVTMIKKLIEVSIPLDLINDESAYDKMPGIGAHPKGLHHWWARLPLPAARAVLFATLVDDPSSHPDRFPTEAAQLAERERLFGLMRNLLQKKIHTKPQAYRNALEEIKKHCNGHLPTVHDPFSGGGSIPLEGMRMGLPVIAADLNPVAVMINKVMLEILPRFSNQRPINPESQKKYTPGQEFTNARGLAEDVRYYGRLINEEAKKRIGHIYPRVTLDDGTEATVINWFWARTVQCPNPACGCQLPLANSLILKKRGGEVVYVKPVIEHKEGKNEITRYVVETGEPEIKKTMIPRRGAKCICCGELVPLSYIRQQGFAKSIGYKLLALSYEGKKRRGYYYDATHDVQVSDEEVVWRSELELADNPRNISPQLYGYTVYGDLFTNRQLVVMNTLSQLIKENRQQIIVAGHTVAYANAITTLLSFSIDRLADYNSTLSRWKASGEQQMQLFNRQSIPMVWDFSEANLLSDRAICWSASLDLTAAAAESVLSSLSTPKQVINKDAALLHADSTNTLLISTDPPYYDNVPYADVSDFFYVWMRRNLSDIYPEIFSTIQTPKQKELVASKYRFNGESKAAREFFINGFNQTFHSIIKNIDKRFPITVYYAFKQEEGDESNEDSDELLKDQINLTTGWETMLEGLIQAGFQITATWPVKASGKWRMVARDTNALTSYIVLACRPRPDDAKPLTRQEFLRELRRELGRELHILQQSNLAPVDLAQAAIGPGMGVYSKYSRILEQDGSSMRVRTALQLINRAVDEVLTEQEAEFDAETRWAIDWYSQTGHNEGDYGDAESLSRAKNTAVSGLAEAGIVRSGGGKVRLLRRDELSGTWDPAEDGRVVLWEITQHLIKQLQENGEIGAAKLYKQLSNQAEPARELAYRLFTICEKKGWSQDALAYNSLVLSWQDIVSESSRVVLTDRKGQYGLDF